MASGEHRVITHFQLSAEEGTQVGAMLASRCLDVQYLTSKIDPFKEPRSGWVVFTPPDCWPSQSLLDALGQKSEEKRNLYHYPWSIDHGDTRLINRDESALPSRDAVQQSDRWAVALPIHLQSNPAYQLRSLAERESFLWFSRGNDKLLRKIEGWLANENTAGTLCLSRNDVLPLSIQPAIRVINVDSGISDNTFDANYSTIIFLCPLTVSILAAIVEALLAKNITVLHFKGLFYDCVRWPESVFAISTLLGAPTSVDCDDHTWTLNWTADSISPKWRSGQFQPLINERCIVHSSLEKRRAIIGAASDNVEGVIEWLLNWRDDDAYTCVLDTASSSPALRVACCRLGISYLNLAGALENTSEGGQFIEACGWLPNGEWLLIPAQSSMLELAPAHQSAESPKSHFTTGKSTESKVRDMIVALGIVGLLSSEEVRESIKGHVIAGPSMFRLEAAGLEEWSAAVALAHGIGYKGIELALAILTVAQISRGQGICRPARLRRRKAPASAVRDHRPDFVMSRSVIVVLLLRLAPNQILRRKLLAWPGNLRSRTIAVVDSRYKDRWQFADGPWSDTYAIDGAMFRKDLELDLNGVVGSRGSEELVAIANAQTDPQVGAVLVPRANYDKLACLQTKGGPTIVNRRYMSKIKVSPFGEVGDIVSTGGVVATYDGAAMGWRTPE